MFNLPIYKRGNVYTLHTRINGKQVKLSLRTHDRWVAANRAIEVLNAMKFDSDPPLPAGFEHLVKAPVKRYEVDAQRGIFKADGPEDHARLMEALRLAKELQSASPPPAPTAPPVVIIQEPRVKGGRFTIKKLWEDFSLAKTLKAASIRGFETAVQEFNRHVNSRQLHQITHTDIATFIAALKTKGNSDSSVDKKVGYIRTLINFAIKMRSFEGENVAAEKNLQTKEERDNRGQKALRVNDLVETFNRAEYRNCKDSDPAYFYINTLAMITGMRVSSIARLKANDLKTTIDGITYLDIDDDKTPSGRRDVCIPDKFHAEVKKFLQAKGSFGLSERKKTGQGFSDPVRKSHQAYLASIKYDGRPFTSHAYRKTFNHYLIDEKVDIEIRCQLLGHAINNVNVSVYGKNRPSLAVIASAILPLQTTILKHLGLS